MTFATRKELLDLAEEVGSAVVVFGTLGALVTGGVETTWWIATSIDRPFAWGLAASGGVAGTFFGTIFGILSWGKKTP